MIFTKKAQGKSALDPMVGLFVTIVVNNAVNIIFMVIRHFVWHPVPINSTGILLFVFGGTLNSFVGRGLLFASVALLGAAKAGLMKTFVPVFAVLGGVFVLGERLGHMAWLGIVIVLFGLFLVSLDSVLRSRTAKAAGITTDGSGITEGSGDANQLKRKAERRRLLKGFLAGLGAALFLGTGNVCRKAGITLIPDTVVANFFCSIFALSACVIVLLVRGKGRKMLTSLRHLEINYVISGLFATGALYFLFMAMRYIPISIANSISSIEPLFTILIVWFIKEGKKEKLGIEVFFFGIIMVIGTIILIMK